MEKGTKLFTSGDLAGQVEKGEFKDNILHGQGMRICPVKYHGECKEPTEFGYSLSWGWNYKGKIEEGQFLNGELKKGKITFFDGTILKGRFSNDCKLEGLGKEISPDGTVKEGYFQYGGFKAEKKTYYKENATYEGILFGGVGGGTGEGKATYPDGTVAKGYFSQWDFKEGKKTYPNKIVEMGSFYTGGKKYYPDGKIEQKFSTGVLHGQGERIYPDGKVEKGAFEYGNLIST